MALQTEPNIGLLPTNFQKPSISNALQRAWEEFKTEPEKYVLFTILGVGLPLLLGGITFIAKFIGIILFIVIPPLQTGTSAYYHHKLETKKTDFNFFFNPYRSVLSLCIYQLVLLAGSILITLPLVTWSVIASQGNSKMSIFEMGLPIQIFSFITLGALLYFLICASFAPYFIYFYKLNVKESLKKSFKVIHPRWLWFFGLLLFFMLLMLAGFLAVLVGVFVAIPIIRLTSYNIFAEYTGLDAQQVDVPQQNVLVAP